MSTPDAIRSRAWAGPADLAGMTAAVSAAWAGPRRPFVSCTVGDLEWWTALGGPDADWSTRIRLWEAGGRVLGWAWLTPPATFEWFVAESSSRSTQQQVRDGILAWGREAVAAHASAAATDPPPTHAETWAADSSPEAAALAEHGWTAGTTELTEYHQPLDAELDAPRVPDGYRLRTMRGPEDVPARVAVHRAAFAPSKMTVEKYAILSAQPHYDWARDVVVEAPDGSFAAFAICWADAEGSVGEFEPVGVHPDHQRRGLGRVVMRAGLRILRDAGIRDAIVFSLRANAASEALYRSAGFDQLAMHRSWTTPLADDGGPPPA